MKETDARKFLKNKSARVNEFYGDVIVVEYEDALKAIAIAEENVKQFEPYKAFYEHIRKHLDEMGMKEQFVMCKICNYNFQAITGVKEKFLKTKAPRRK